MGHDPLCDVLVILTWLWLGMLVYEGVAPEATCDQPADANTR